MAVFCSKGPLAKTGLFSHAKPQTAIFGCFEEHAFAVAKRTRPCKTIHAVQSGGHHGPCEEVQ